MVKVNWDVEELVALIDVYINYHHLSTEEINDKLSALSVRLNRRAALLQIPHDEKYRNLTGMKMMYQNVVYAATNGERGLSCVGMKLRETYQLFLTNPTMFRIILKEFNQRYPA